MINLNMNIGRLRQVGGVVIAWALSLMLLVNSALAGNAPDNANKIDPLGVSKYLRGNAQVSEFSGAAIYSYDVTLPQGRKNMTPSLSFSYNGQDASFENIAGYRWGMTEYYIQRTNEAGVEKMYTRNDFMISAPFDSGELNPVQLTDGTHGKYGLEREGTFARYEFSADNTWTVTTKDGTVYRFGATQEAQQYDLSDSSRIYKWMLETVTDANGNTIHFEYAKEGNQIYPKSIFYGSINKETAPFEVRFILTDAQREDHYLSYASGFEIRTNRLIKTIEVYVEDELRKQVEINYTTINPLLRNTIQEFVETGYNLAGEASTKPATQFEYTPSSVSWEKVENQYQPSWLFTEKDTSDVYHSDGDLAVYSWDMNGDGLVDFEYTEAVPGGGKTHYRAVNNGDGTWAVETAGFLTTIPNTYGSFYQIPYTDKKVVDFDGNARSDILIAREHLDNGVQFSEIRDHNNQVTGLTLPMGFLDTSVGNQNNFYPANDAGTVIADLNGDGLPDLAHKKQRYSTDDNPKTSYTRTCLSDGDSCDMTNLWQLPHNITIDYQQDTLQYREGWVEDCNYDGLADFYGSGEYLGPGWNNIYYLNNGQGGFVEIDDNAEFCKFIGNEHLASRSLDANGDGILDAISAWWQPTGGSDIIKNELTIKTMNTVDTETFSGMFPVLFGQMGNNGIEGDNGVRILDLNGDKLPDVMQAYRHHPLVNGTYATEDEIGVYLNTGSRPYFLKKVTSSEGSTVEFEYKTSAQHRRSDGTLANPSLPFIVDTVSKVITNPGVGPTMTTEYIYEDGHYYYDHAYDREYAGFNKVTKTDSAGVKTVSYYHQSENSLDGTAQGEYQDHISKKGMPYRVEIRDASDVLQQVTINKVDKYDLGNDRHFPFTAETVNILKTGDEVATAQGFNYDLNGNQVQVMDYGEVIASNNGNFVDTGSDLLRTEINYAENVDAHILALPSGQEVYDQGNNKISHSRFYYDNLDLNQVNLGNQTRAEAWLDTEDRFIGSDTIYSTYGLPTSTTNSRGYTTNMSYDVLNLYPTQVTNALGHTSTTTVDIATGNPTLAVDPNGFRTETTYDGRGRPIEVRVGNPINPNSTLKSQDFAYADAMPRMVRVTSYNDDAIQVSNFQYFDGLGRLIEEKSEASQDKWITTMNFYNSRGNLEKSTQPFYTNDASYSVLDSNKLGTEFAYDALNRVVSEASPLGTTSTAYSGFNKTVTDLNGNQKHFESDVRSRLIKVTEVIDGLGQNTEYVYSSQGNLIQIKDAAGNTREFTYDSLGRKLTQNLAHKPGVGGDNFTYTYDDNSNLVLQSDPKGQVVNYTYDALDRVTIEDYVGEAGNELTYTYDSGLYSKGRLTQAVAPEYQHDLTYDLHGRVTMDQKLIKDKLFTFKYTYDLMGGVKTMEYPEGSIAYYDYDQAHQLMRVAVDEDVFADEFKYTSLGQIESMRIGQTVVTSSDFDETQMYRMTGRNTEYNGVKIQDYSYSYDAMGNLTNLVDANSGQTAKTVDYTYDDLYRLTSAAYSSVANSTPVTETYSYDAIGNILNKSDVGAYTYDSVNPHAVVQVGSKTFAYDANGNMTTHESESQEYDYKNRLIQSGSLVAYGYGEDIDRMFKTDLDTGNTRYYPNDLYEIDEDEEVRYVYAGDQRVGKLTRLMIAAPELNEVDQTVQSPFFTITGSKEQDLALYLNGAEVLPLGNDTVWSTDVTLTPGENTFNFYTVRDDGERSKSVVLTLNYDLPAPTLDFVDSPVYSTKILLTGAKRANTGLYINGEEAVALDALESWSAEVALTQESNTFVLESRDVLDQVSSSISTQIAYVALPPTLDDNYLNSTSNPRALSGTKAQGMGIYINDVEVVAPNDETTWEYSQALVKGANSFQLKAVNEYGIESPSTAFVITYEFNGPNVDPVDPVSDTHAYLSGTKRANTSLWINGVEQIENNGSEAWGILMPLTGLETDFEIYTVDAANVESDKLTLTVEYHLYAPTVDQIPSTTTSNPFTFTGTKTPGTSIVLNGQRVVDYDDAGVWIYSANLSEGANTFEVYSESPFGVESDKVNFEINYTKPAVSTVVNTTTTTTSTPSGGGYTNGSAPAVQNSIVQLRMQQKEQDLSGDELSEEEKPIDVTEVKVEEIPQDRLAKVKLVSQTPPKPKIPKNLKPEVEPQTKVEFKNLEIIYKHNKVFINWDPMSREAASFEVYKSKRGFPHNLSKHATVLAGNLKPDSVRNRFVDTGFIPGEKHVYRVVALNHLGEIIASSIQLNFKKLFIKGSESTVIDMQDHTDYEFDKIYFGKNDYIDVESVSGTKYRFTPQDGFTEGTQLRARFLSCEQKENGKDYCEKIGEELIDTYVIGGRKTNRFGALFNNLFAKFTPNAYAQEVIQDDSKIYYLLQDHLGGTDVILDKDFNVFARYDYMPFGSERVTEGDEKEAHRYTGQELDEETGLYYYGARYYDSDIGRFISVDPLVMDEAKKSQVSMASVLKNPQLLNAFTYTLNNPVKFIDPTGESTASNMAWGIGAVIDSLPRLYFGTALGLTSPFSANNAVVGSILIADGTERLSSGIRAIVTGEKFKRTEVKNAANTLAKPQGVTSKIFKTVNKYSSNATGLEEIVLMRERGDNISTKGFAKNLMYDAKSKLKQAKISYDKIKAGVKQKVNLIKKRKESSKKSDKKE